MTRRQIQQTHIHTHTQDEQELNEARPLVVSWAVLHVTAREEVDDSSYYYIGHFRSLAPPSTTATETTTTTTTVAVLTSWTSHWIWIKLKNPIGYSGRTTPIVIIYLCVVISPVQSQ